MKILDIGIKSYTDTLEIQFETLKKRINGDIPDTLIIVEHHPVVTLGRRSNEENIIDRTYFDDRSIPVVFTGRGGEVTCHGPGQIVLYPVVDLKSIGKGIAGYIDLLERTVSSALNKTGIASRRIDGKRGVWVHDRKIAFIGIAVKRWVAYHGVAVNVNNDLEHFLKIHPCGHREIKVTSIREESGKTADIDQVKNVLADQFVADIDPAVCDGQELRVNI